MDTELKKFNSLFFKKAIALLLCMISVALMANQVSSSYLSGVQRGITYRIAEDALGQSFFGNAADVWSYGSFHDVYDNYLNLLGRNVSVFGDGSEEAYKKRKAAIDDQQELSYETDKRNFINAVSANRMYFMAGIYKGAIEQVDVVYTEGTDEEEFWVEDYQVNDFINENGISEGYEKPAVPDDIKVTFKDKEYDGIFYNEADLSVTHYTDENYGDVMAHYSPGYYAFKVNDAELKKELYSDNVKESFFSDYESFYREYSSIQNTLKNDYPSGRYFIRDFSGKVYTNITELSAEATSGEISAFFEESYDRYSYLSEGGDMCLNNGRIYNAWFYDSMKDALSSYVYYNGAEGLTAVTSEYETSVTHITVPAVTGENSVAVTEPETTRVVHTTMVTVPEPTTRRNAAVEKIISYDGYECYIAVDFEKEEENCLFQNTKNSVFIAEDIIKECMIVCGLGLLIIIFAFIYLISKAEKKEGRFCFEVRTVIDVGAVILAGIGALAIIGAAVNNTYNGFTLLFIDILAVIAFVFVTDLILYVAGNIKNKSFLKSFGVVRLLKFFAKKVKRVYLMVSDRLLYTKELQKTVFIRTAIVIGINIIVGSIAFLTAISHAPRAGLLLVVLLFLFDLYILYRGMCFVMGTEKLFNFVKEMRNGNLDISINKNALPGYLYLPAENLQCLSEGIKAAVDEAVRQEKAKTELITNVSHDLKTPLTSIINYVDLMKKCDISDETALSYLQVLSEKSDRLKVLIEDLVEASKASAGVLSVDFVCVSCRELVNQILGEVEESFTEKNLNVVLNIPENDVKIKADSKHIYRVLENLFINVKKYALESTRVYITVSERNGKGVINIKNISAAPLNISADELKERFVRGEQSRTTEGNGLGLSIAENLCTLQNGSLNIEIIGDLFSVTVEMEKFR